MADAKIRIQGDVSGFTDSMQQAERSVDGFSVSLGKVDKNANSLKAAMKTATKQAQDLAFQLSKMSDVELQSDFGQQLQAQFQTAMKAAADLKDQFGDVNQEIKNLASDTTGLDAMKQGVGVLSSGLSGLASVYGLVGGNTEEFAKALVAVNAIQNISNTITGIANALQKQSALMVGLRAAKNAILGTSIAAATAAETANTAAVGANTAATTAATAAQWSLNAAVLANPYVAAAVAIAALCAGIYLWVDSMEEATAGEAALAAATEALSAELETTMKTAGEQISLFDDLKAQYDASGAKVDEFAKKIVNNTDVQKKLGVVTKTVDDVHRLFAQNSEQYRRATLARAQALAAETAQATMLGQTLAQLSKIQAKLAAGEEVNWSELKDIVKAAGYNDSDANKIMIKAGFEIEGEFFGKDDVRKATGDFNKLVSEIMKGGSYKSLQDMADDVFKPIFNEINSTDYNGILSSSLDALDKSVEKAGKTASKSAKKTKDEIKKVLTTLEGCDAIIQQAEKDMKKLDSTSATYVKDMERLKNVKLTAQVAKLQLIDKSSVSGLLEARALIEQIMKTLPQGAPVLEELNRQLKDCDEKLYDMFEKMSNDGNIRALKEAKSQIEKIIETLPQGSAEIKLWADRLNTVNGRLKSAQQEADNAAQGIQKGSAAYWKQQIQALKAEKEKLADAARIWEIDIEIENAEDELRKWEAMARGPVKTQLKVEPNYFDYRDMPQPKTVNLADVATEELLKQIKDLEKQIENEPNVEIKANLVLQKEGLEQAVSELRSQLKNAENALQYQWNSDDLEKMTDREINGLKEYTQGLADAEQDFIDQIDQAIQQAYGVERKLLQNEKKIHEIIKNEYQKQAIYIEIKADIKQYKSQIAELRETTAKDFLGATEGLYSAFADLPKQLDECENAAEGFFKVMEAGFSIFDQIKTIIQDLQEMSELFKMLKGAEAKAQAVEPKGGVVPDGSISKEKLTPLLQERGEIEAEEQAKLAEVRSSEGVSRAADQATTSLDNLAGSATKAAGAIGAGASPQPPASEGVDMVSLAGGGADSEFEVTPVVNEGALREQSDKIKEILSSGAGSGLAEAMKLPEGADKITETIKAQSAAFAELASVKEGAAMAQEGLTAAQQIGNVATEAGTVIAGANTVATEGQTAATEGQAIANVGEAVSETAKQNSKMGPFGWIAAIAAGAALFASLMSMMKFAEGGIVGGSTTIGDRVVARLNAGEMVLNKNQQSKLFKMINEGTISGNNVNVGGSIRIKGSDLMIALSNYDKTRKTNRNL